MLYESFEGAALWLQENLGWEIDGVNLFMASLGLLVALGLAAIHIEGVEEGLPKAHRGR